jgi:D,D-heptose 1,7-bisphosphate phosphatase
MIPIGGKPLLEHHIEMARRHGFTEILIFAGYRAELIQDYFGDGSRFGVRLSVITEREPLGTAGAVFEGFERLADSFLVLYGDTMPNVDLSRIWNEHHTRGADATLLLHPNDHPLDSDLVEVSAEGWVRKFHNRPHPAGEWFQNLVNAGLYVIRKEALRPWAERKERLDFGKDVFPQMVGQGGRLFGYNSFEYIKDIGTPERYDRVCAEYASGVVSRSSLETPQRAVLLDRDGTLNPDLDCLRRAEDLTLLPGVAAAVRELNHHGWRAVVVTNQPVIAKGFCTEAELQRIHNKLETLLGLEHAFLDRIYFCPHHPVRGFAGERLEYKVECECRKPAPGMVLRAASELNLDLNQCWLVGDRTTDLQTAANAGVRSILVRTGQAGLDGRHSATPDAVFDTLGEAVQFILRNGERNT